MLGFVFLKHSEPKASVIDVMIQEDTEKKL